MRKRAPIAAPAGCSWLDGHYFSLAGCLRFYGMTQAEARLASMIVDGRPLLEVARQLHITRNTARTHMKRIYAKTETHSQAALLRLLMTSSGE